MDKPLLEEGRKKWWILFAMTASLSMVYIDVSVLPVALPTLSRELNFSYLGLQWIINVYTLTLTVLALAGGKLAQTFGLKRSFCFGLLLFALASALCGLSSVEYQMIGARILQGAGASIMIPSQQAIIFETFPPRQRGKALGFLVSISSIFLTMGPLVGGNLTQYLSWRYIFWINIPLAIFGIIFTLLVVPRFKQKSEPFDWFGFLTLGTGVTSIMVGTMHIQSWGLRSPLTLALLALGVALITFLYKKERKVKYPLFDTAIFRTRSFIGGALSTSCNAFIVMITFYWAVFFQDILNYNPSQAGALTCFSYAPILFVAPVAGYLADRYGPRLPVSLGFSLVILSLCAFLFVATQHILWMLLICLLLFGFSMPLIFTPSFVTLMHEVPSEKRAMASGINSTLRQFSSSFGIALFGTIFQHWHYWKFARALEKNPSTQSLSPLTFEGLLSNKPTALHAFNNLPEQTQSLVHGNAVQSYIAAFHAINLFAIFCAIAGVVISWRFLKNTPSS